MSEDQFTKLLTAALAEQSKQLDKDIDQRLNKALAEQSDQIRKDFKEQLKTEIDPLAETVGEIYNLLDEDVEGRTKDEQERAATNHQLARHESWIKRIAKHVGMKLVT